MYNENNPTRILRGVTRTVRMVILDGSGHAVDLSLARKVAVTVSLDGAGKSNTYTPGITIGGDGHNVVSFVWYADMQQRTGRYTLELVADYGDRNKARVNWHSEFGVELVEYNAEESGSLPETLELDSYIDLTGSVSMNGVGMSAYEQWLASDYSEGYEQSVDGFMAWIQRPATDAEGRVIGELGSRDESEPGDETMWGDYKSAERQRGIDYGTAEGSKSGSTINDGSRWGEYFKNEQQRNNTYSTAEQGRNTEYNSQEGNADSPISGTSRWSKYKGAEAARNIVFGDSQSERTTAYQTAEGTASSPSGNGSRWGAYKAAEAARGEAYVAAEGSKAGSSSGDGSRWGAYKSEEAARGEAFTESQNARTTAYNAAEGTANGSASGDGSRWGAYKAAEAARNSARETAEGTSSSQSGDGSRWGAYKAAEAARGEAYNAAEGTESGSVAGDGSRWGAYKAAEAARAAEMNAKADKDTDAVEGNVAKFDDSGNPVDAGYSAMRIHRDLGYNAAQSIIALTPGETGKYVKCSTRSAVANANFNISAPFDVDACSELLIKTGYNPSDNSHAALDISVIAIYEEMERTRTVQAKDGNNNPLYYEVDEDGNPTSTQTTTPTPYPVYTTETYTEHRYLPNNEDRWVAIPDSGYYVANIPQSCKCVISYKPGVTDTNVIVVKHGALANLTSQIFGIYEHRTMAEAVTSLAYRIAALESRIQRPGNIEVGSIDAIDITRYRHPQVLTATGVPSASLRPTNLADDIPWDGIPAFVGEFYFAQWKEGATTKVRLYFATGIAAVADWLLIYSLN